MLYRKRTYRCLKCGHEEDLQTMAAIAMRFKCPKCLGPLRLPTDKPGDALDDGGADDSGPASE